MPTQVYSAQEVDDLIQQAIAPLTAQLNTLSENTAAVTASLAASYAALDERVTALEEASAPAPDPDPTPDPDPAPVAPPATGIITNSQGPEDWSTAYQFINLLRQVRNSSFISKHASGTVLWTSVIQPFAALWDLKSDPFRTRNTELHCFWSGGGDITLSGGGIGGLVSSSPGHKVYALNSNGIVNVEVTGVNSSDPMSFPAVVFGELVPEYQEGKVFNPYYVDLLKGISCNRMLQFGESNNSALADWNDRPLVSHLSWASRGGRADEGVPVEVMCELCIEIGCRPWFVIPHLADKDFIQQHADLVKFYVDNHGLAKPRYEVSNETWNGQFSQHAHYKALGNVWFAGQSTEKYRGRAAYALTARAAGAILKDIFGADGVDMVIASQAVNLDAQRTTFETTLINATTRHPWLPLTDLSDPAQYIDELSIATYWNNDNNNGLVGATPAEWAAKVDWDDFERGIDEVDIRAAALGLKWVPYEGGSHQMYGGITDAAEPAAITYHASTEIVAVAERAYDYMATKPNWTGEFNRFASVGAWNDNGCWTIYRHLLDDNPLAVWTEAIIAEAVLGD